MTKKISSQSESAKALTYPRWLFQHQELMQDLDKAKKIKNRNLINTLNYMHFMGRHILVHLRHPKFHESLLLKADPEPCIGKDLTCHWTEEYQTGLELEKYQFVNLFIEASRAMISVQGTLREISNKGLTIELAEAGYTVGRRWVRRYDCRGIAVEIVQNGFHAKGELLDFSALNFRTRVKPEPSFSFHGFNVDETVNVQIRNNGQLYFSGNCRSIRDRIGHNEGEIVFVPLSTTISRFKKRHFRNNRKKLNPQPILVFDHPFITKRIQLEVSDISSSGFSVLEDEEQGVLMPGLIVPDLSINFAGAVKMKCLAQVIYREAENEKEVRCGISILDMDINTFGRLTDILLNISEPYTHVSREVDLDELWEFFFSTGFIYPKKYGLIYRHREDFKKTYQKLYQESPEIAKHIVCQKKGRILGHISMIRIYEKAWMIHHHAARGGEMMRAGIKVLRLMMIFLFDVYRLPSAKMDYVISFFRPESRFPNRIFGDFARSLKNKGGCSMDLFSYFSLPTASFEGQIPQPWSLSLCSPTDLLELDQFYRHSSGGLMLDAFRLKPENHGEVSLENLYAGLGFFRKCLIYALKHGDELNAVFIVNQSDLGVNLSELTNAIQVLVTDPVLPWDILSRAIRKAATSYENMEKVPVLIYPKYYVDSKGIDYERQYYLWIKNVLYGDEFLKYVQESFGVTYQ